MSDSLSAQVMDINEALHEVEHTLAQDWSLWCIQSIHDGRRDATRRSELYRSFESLQSELGQACPRHHIQWSYQSWPGPCAKILSFLGLKLEWRQRRRASEHAGSPDTPPGRRPDAAQLGQELHVLHAVRPREHQVRACSPRTGMELPQAKWRRVDTTEDHHVSPLTSKSLRTGPNSFNWSQKSTPP